MALLSLPSKVFGRLRTGCGWLWTWELDDGDEDEDLAKRDPTGPETKEVKLYVERELDECLPGFMAVWRNGATTRELLYFAINDFRDAPRADKPLGSFTDASWDEEYNYWKDQKDKVTTSQKFGL